MVSCNLTHAQQTYIASLGPIRVSNEMDWPPIDYAVAGQPSGYTIDLLHLIAKNTGLRFEFINGYSWVELRDMFNRGDLEVLQPIFKVTQNQSWGLFSQPLLTLPYAVVTTPKQATITNLLQLQSKKVAIPAGWSILPIIRQYYPTIQIVEVASSVDALQAVAQGEADATLDTSVVLHHTAEQFFIANLKFHENITFDLVNLPQQLHLLTRHTHPELATILDAGLASITNEQRIRLAAKWFRGTKYRQQAKAPAVVPYQYLLQLTKDKAKLNRIDNVQIEDREVFVFASLLNREKTPQEYFALVIGTDVVLGESLENVKISFRMALLFLVLLPMFLFFVNTVVNQLRKPNQ